MTCTWAVNRERLPSGRAGLGFEMNVDLKQTSLALVGDLIAGTFLEVRSSKLRVRVSPHQGKQQIRYADMTT